MSRSGIGWGIRGIMNTRISELLKEQEAQHLSALLTLVNSTCVAKQSGWTEAEIIDAVRVALDELKVTRPHYFEAK